MTSDCYAILGVTPTAEDVVIGAAYRALMRHYHPDTNPDPLAQVRAQQISAAYAVLRDPARRAEYDAQRGAGGMLWQFDEPGEPPPPMRTAGIATALLAVLVVGAVWAWPRPAMPPEAPSTDLAATRTAPDAEPAATARPPVRPPLPPPPAVAAPAVAPPAEALPAEEPQVVPAAPVRLAMTERRRPVPEAAAPSRPAAKPAVPRAQPAASDPPAPGGRVATLDRISSGFFSQSMVHASAAKKDLLLAARDRSAAQRKACRTDSCVADAYVREIRETSAIMESRGGPE